LGYLKCETVGHCLAIHSSIPYLTSTHQPALPFGRPRVLVLFSRSRRVVRQIDTCVEILSKFGQDCSFFGMAGDG
jgi:hypothetical protein